MDSTNVTKNYRMSQWMEIIKRRQSSGKTVEAFCEEEGISKNAYYYWQRKLRESACEELAKHKNSTTLLPAGWAQLTTEASVSPALEIEVAGCRININDNTDLNLLKNVCRTLRSLQ